MITSFSLGNFKAFSKTQQIPIKPITLIFGANSAGKSSIIHALMLAQHAQAFGDFDVINTSKGGDSIDFGGFHQYIYKHNLSKSLELAFSMQMEGNNRKQNRRIEISVAVPFDDLGHRVPYSIPEIVRYDVSSSDKLLLRVSKRKDNLFGIDELDPSIIKSKFRNEISINGETFTIDTKGSDVLSVSQDYKLRRHGLIILPVEDVDVLMRNLFINSDGRRKPNTGSRVSFNSARFALFNHLSSVMHPVESELKSFLKSIWYLGPLRTYPPRHVSGSKYNDSNWYAGGGYAWEIVRKNKSVREKVNAWLRDTSRLQTPYELIIRELYDVNHIEESLVESLDELNAWQRLMTELDIDGSKQTDQFDADSAAEKIVTNLKETTSEKVLELVLIDRRNDTPVSHRDIGVGVSQVLPVLAYAYANTNSLIAIEQPEIHLHPALQADIADVFIESALGTQRNRFIIETHSEHMILRVLRRIRETTNGTIEGNQMPIRPNDVAVLWVSSKLDGAEITEIPITPDGDFEHQWPEGFFPERAKELF